MMGSHRHTCFCTRARVRTHTHTHTLWLRTNLSGPWPVLEKFSVAHEGDKGRTGHRTLEGGFCVMAPGLALGYDFKSYFTVN